jgi:hypothetical protein
LSENTYGYKEGIFGIGIYRRKDTAKLEWEEVKQEVYHCNWGYILRAKVPGGWLARILIRDGGLTFVHDPNHEWK